MNPVLVDSWALIALMDPRDSGHIQAVDASKQLVAGNRITVVSLLRYFPYDTKVLADHRVGRSRVARPISTGTMIPARFIDRTIVARAR